ncbi:YdaU family protein [Bordetella trematum]|uniref:YdaU family protein n=1 Tax=Bordetella trematum TaxID=123899 RepID=UPI00047293EF|nr:YdaU family protein [Bordetella trematum]
MNYYPHHIGDFNSATRHLTRLERSVYRDMLDLYYDTESPLTLDMDGLCRLLIARSNEERTAVEQVLNEFFTETEQGWRHSRCDTEIERYHAQREAKSAAGKASAAKRAQKTQQPSSSSSTGVQQPFNDCATNQNQNQEPIKETPPNPRKRGQSFDASAIDLPDWLDREDWAAWVADRKARKKPITEKAAELQIKQLADLRHQGHAPADVIAHSIASGYQGLFAPSTPNRTAQPGKAQRLADWNDELRDVLAESGRPAEIFMGTIDATH